MLMRGCLFSRDSLLILTLSRMLDWVIFCGRVCKVCLAWATQLNTIDKEMNRMRQRLLTILSILLVLVPVVQATEQVRVAGSTTVLPIVAEAAKHFRQLHPGLSLTVSGGGSGVGVASIDQGLVEIGMASRDLTTAEKQRLQGKVWQVAIARDAVAVAVSKAVYEAGVTQLSLAQIAAIYRGEIKNWQQLGGPDRRILVIDKEASRGTRHVFARVVLGSGRARAPGASIITGSNNEEQAAIANSDKAIGMLSHAWLNDAVRAVAVGEANKAVLPTFENVANGRYPIQRQLKLLVSETNSEIGNAFIDFMLSSKGQQLVQQVGYLPVH